MTGTAGVPVVLDDLVVELPWGDPDGIEAGLRGREADLAAIIVEPVQGAGGVRAPEPDFLPFLRALAERHGALLIFDEIISFRVAPGGAQERYGVRPDLTTLGKIIGGGYPLAAFGGRADVMALFDARQAGRSAMAGRSTAIRSRRRPVWPRCASWRPTPMPASSASGNGSTRGVAGTIARDGHDARVAASDRCSRCSSVRGRRHLRPASPAAPTLSLGLLLDGFAIAPRGMGAIPTVATEADIDDLAAAIGRALRVLGSDVTAPGLTASAASV